MKYLVILSNTFPDSNFIKDELEYFNKFDQILYYPKPINSFNEAVNISNIKLIITNMDNPWEHFRRNSNIKQFLERMKIFFLRDFWCEVLKIFRKKYHNKENANLILNIKELVNYILAAQDYYEQIIKDFNLKKISIEDEFVFYSYRFHVHSYTAVLLKLKFPKSIAISRAHGYDLYEYRSDDYYIPLRSETIRKLEQVFFISQDGEKYMKKLYPKFISKYKVSYLGTEDLGKQDWSPSKTMRILSCSRISKEKRIELFLNLFEQLKMKVIWTHIGDGDDMEELQNIAKKLETKDKQFIFLGYLTNREIFEFYKNNEIDWFINLSDNEGIPVTMMEAMSFGIPVLGTDVGGVSEIIRNGYNGYLYPVDFEIKEIIAVLNKSNSFNDNSYFEMRENARYTYERKFSATYNYSNFSEMISCLEQKNVK